MDKAELSKVCLRVLGGEGTDGEVAIVALALQRYLVGEGRRAVFDKRSYQREYMRAYRLRGKRGKVKVRKRR